MRASPLIIAMTVLIAGAAFAPALAHAHAFPTAEQPLVGATVNTSPSQITITYDAPIESLFARLEVLNGAGQNETAGPPHVARNQHELSVTLKPLKRGDYTVKWSVVAEDGHRTEGSYVFTVAGGGPR